MCICIRIQIHIHVNECIYVECKFIYTHMYLGSKERPSGPPATALKAPTGPKERPATSLSGPPVTDKDLSFGTMRKRRQSLGMYIFIYVYYTSIKCMHTCT
jgi:hypothetical protein